jgi:hypothetical protein
VRAPAIAPVCVTSADPFTGRVQLSVIEPYLVRPRDGFGTRHTEQFVSKGTKRHLRWSQVYRRGQSCE